MNSIRRKKPCALNYIITVWVSLLLLLLSLSNSLLILQSSYCSHYLYTVVVFSISSMLFSICLKGTYWSDTIVVILVSISLRYPRGIYLFYTESRGHVGPTHPRAVRRN